MTPTPPGCPAEDTVTEQFLDHRELLFSVVYNMLGSVADTEDTLQEVWLAWAARHRGPGAEPVDNARAYLTRVAVNQALARRARLSRRRETYVGPWLPEPLLVAQDDASDGAERAEALSMAVLVVLETLSPLERAVFVLHEVFGFAHPEIARILDRSPTAVRQLATRARRHVQARRPRHRPPREQHARVTERFAEAALGGDLRALLEVLAPDVTLWTDGGGKGPAVSLRPVHGRDRVAAVFTAVARALPPEGVDVRYRLLAGDPGALVFSGGSPLAVLVVDLAPDGEHIAGVFSVTNPDKLAGIPAPRA
ncbi:MULTISPECIES: RNA polymerase sigma factor SigJ [Streptomyces]|uniref:RNA polymerase sigma factor SigJ n=2 Tax=Streptomyces TaxID=1883 RepID=A0ABW6YPH9_9ACTN|nr:MULTISPECIES: RNA polymerase sigma factor SigJ [Streptomyces]MCL3995517.1 RNA polymerase sigma factor SigJ [Streptomyces lavenduligriseus]QIS74689.1 RNA polymerase sigma factor SigJ [Streptomyces sp. DSM 40868]WDM10718.1 RNA polymerase sigma factor SigJ [Streptomyces lavenduligriseus]